MGSASVTLIAPPTSYPQNDIEVDMKQTFFKIGLEAEYILPFNKRTWSVFTNPSYQKFSGNEDYYTPGLFVSSEPTRHTATFDYSTIEIPVGFRYYFFLGKSSKIFVNAAFVVNVTLDSELLFQTNNTAMEYDIVSKNNVMFGAGYSYKRVSAALQLNTKRNLFGSYATYSSTALVLGYTIF